MKNKSILIIVCVILTVAVLGGLGYFISTKLGGSYGYQNENMDKPYNGYMFGWAGTGNVYKTQKSQPMNDTTLMPVMQQSVTDRIKGNATSFELPTEKLGCSAIPVNRAIVSGPVPKLLEGSNDPFEDRKILGADPFDNRKILGGGKLGYNYPSVNFVPSKINERKILGSYQFPEKKILGASIADPTDINTHIENKPLNLPLIQKSMGVDYIRGDLPIKPIRRDWFDTSKCEEDLVAGGHSVLFGETNSVSGTQAQYKALGCPVCL
jgi:hypothetical protein